MTQRLKLLVTVVARSGAWALIIWTLESWVRIPLKTWMFVRVCVVLSCVDRGFATG
jgi:hypothetical protein